MKILLLSIGTRGDCEPFLGVGEMLRDRGEDVVCCFPEQYRNLAEDSGFSFYSLGHEFLEFIDGADTKTALTGAGFEKLAATIRVMKASSPMQKELLIRQKAVIDEVNPDILIFHPKALYCLIYHLETGKKSIILCPTPQTLHYVENKPHVGFEFLPAKLSYKIANAGSAKFAMMAVNMFFKGKYETKQMLDTFLSLPIFYTVSPSVFPRPAYWRENAIVTGFIERDKTANWTVDSDVQSFIVKHEKPILITFGSMPNSNPAAKTCVVVDVLQELQIPAIINISGGGLIEPEHYDNNLIKFVPLIPYDWAFSKMYAVVHHGGAGTMQSALKAGCATMAVPHGVDQPMWNKIIAGIGAGPEGIGINQLTHSKLKEKLYDLYYNPKYKKNAEKISEKMKTENFSDRLYEFIMNF